MRFLVLAALLVAGCVPSPGPDTPRPVAAVDLARYAGTWFEIARLPNSFQDGDRVCEGTTATYSARPDGQIGVVNRCADAAGAREATATAYAVEGSANARLRVTFFWPFYGDYWVLGLDPEYRWALVGAPDRKFLWLLSRTPVLPQADEEAAWAIARREGFDLAPLRRTTHAGN